MGTDIRMTKRARELSSRLKTGALGVGLAVAVALALPGLTMAQSASPSPAAPTSAAASAAPSSASGAASSPASTASSVLAAPSPSSSAPPAGAAPPSAAPTSASPAAQPGQPVGANPPKEEMEPISIFAYLLIVLAGIWFLYAIVTIVRLALRPPAAAPHAVPPSESGRGFLSFVLPFVAIICVLAIVVGWGQLFLYLASITGQTKIMGITDFYTMITDLLVVCLVMAVAALLATRSSAGRGSAGH